MINKNQIKSIVKKILKDFKRSNRLFLITIDKNIN